MVAIVRVMIIKNGYEDIPGDKLTVFKALLRGFKESKISISQKF